MSAEQKPLPPGFDADLDRVILELQQAHKGALDFGNRVARMADRSGINPCCVTAGLVMLLAYVLEEGEGDAMKRDIANTLGMLAAKYGTHCQVVRMH